jgi:hypothetical protein
MYEFQIGKKVFTRQIKDKMFHKMGSLCGVCNLSVAIG